MYVHVVFDSMVILLQLLLQLVLESSAAFRAKMEGFKCALGKLLAAHPCGPPGQQKKHLLQIRAPLKCFTKSVLSLTIVPWAIQQPATEENVTTPHPISSFWPLLEVKKVMNQNLVLHVTFLLFYLPPNDVID